MFFLFVFFMLCVIYFETPAEIALQFHCILQCTDNNRHSDSDSNHERVVIINNCKLTKVTCSVFTSKLD